jgi:para-aminobenzoate synthetase component I
VPDLPITSRLAWRATPAEVLARWPAARPLAVLWSGAALTHSGGSTPPPDRRTWSRWTIFASPVRTLRIQPGAPGPLARVAATLESTALAQSSSSPIADGGPPFVGGWIGVLGYELGREIEPAVRIAPGERSARGWPIVLLQRCPAAYVHDGLDGSWWLVGSREGVESLPPLTLPDSVPAPRDFRVGPPARSVEPEAYWQAVARAVEYTRAGDIFQANIAHRLTAEFAGSARGLFAAMTEHARPWFGAYIEDPIGVDGRRRAVCSVSPELFLEVDSSRRVITRPIKGTRRADTDPKSLEHSVKDQAELTMIVDLMRNDLGRVCEFGSVEVPEMRSIERHGGEAGALGVHHGVATVRGRLRADVGPGQLLAACFPGGSITGAPKVRSMQIIEELEPLARGPYTGSIGAFSDCGRCALNIAIRTAVLTGTPAGGIAMDRFESADLDYGVGAGIVSDSDPEAEWRETLDKAGPLLAVAAIGRPGPVVVAPGAATAPVSRAVAR